jgi:hypothetical protein
MLVRFYDSPVDSRALAEIVGIDNEELFTAHGRCLWNFVKFASAE